MSTPPKPGKGLSVRVDDELYDDLVTMMRTGMTASDAVKYAAAIVAGAYRNAWLLGVTLDGSQPHIIGCGVQPDQPRHTPPTARTTTGNDGNTVRATNGPPPGTGQE
ncbi:hypothetical protein [Streptomyces sp. NPDC054771]